MLSSWLCHCIWHKNPSTWSFRDKRSLEIALSVSEPSDRSSSANRFDVHGHRDYIVGTLRGQTRNPYYPQEARKMVILNTISSDTTYYPDADDGNCEFSKCAKGINDSNLLLPSFNHNVYDDPRRTSYGLFNRYDQRSTRLSTNWTRLEALRILQYTLDRRNANHLNTC